MPIHICEDLRLEGSRGYVTIEGDSVSEVNSTPARALVLQTAQGRMSQPGVSSTSGPYPIDPETGQPYTDPLQGLKTGTKWRQDFVLQGWF